MALNLRKDAENPIINPSKKETNSDKIDLNNRTVCITGTIPGKTRNVAISELKKKYPRAVFVDSITSYTDYLITGHGVGQTKLKATQKHNVQLIESSKLFN